LSNPPQVGNLPHTQLIGAIYERSTYVCTLAQFESATVLGTIHDPSRAVINAAAVTLLNVKTGVSVRTTIDANGNYEFVNQRLGTYRVQVAMSGFQNAESEPFDLTVNARRR
jgi:hypothetical protein